MTLGDALRLIRAGLQFLPVEMDTPAARAMLLAIGMQESRFMHRRQIRGPARGYWQFEVNGVRGVINHRATSGLARDVLTRLGYLVSPDAVHPVLEDNDILAVVFARLNLYWLPQALPAADDAIGAWAQYIDAWRPGKPHPDTWAAFYNRAWELIQ